MSPFGPRPFGVMTILLLMLAGVTLAETPVRLRVMSYNIHHGEGTDGKLDLRRIARVIGAAKPDVVALQEVDRGVGRSDRVDQVAELAKQTRLRSAFGANLRFDGGDYGNALLTRFEILQQQNHKLQRVDQGEQRGVLDVSLRVPGIAAPLRMLATHFDHRRQDAERQLSAKAVNALIANNAMAPALLAGDLNDRPSSRTLNLLGQHWQSASRKERPTIPVDQPQRQIDFILFRPSGAWKVVSFEVLGESVASDHRPILAVLQWNGNGSPSEVQ